MKNLLNRIAMMALAGTLLAGVAVRAQAQTPQELMLSKQTGLSVSDIQEMESTFEQKLKGGVNSSPTPTKSVLPKAHTRPVSVSASAQEVIVKFQISMSNEHSLIDNGEKLKAAYKADPKSPETHKLTREFCGDWLVHDTEYEAASGAWVTYIQHPPVVPQERDYIWDLSHQNDALGGKPGQLRSDLSAMGVTCPQDITSAPPTKASAENPSEGYIMLVVIFIVGFVLYFLPSVVGNKKSNRWAIFMLNLLAGWTLVGWIVALVWACTAEPPASPPVIPVVNPVSHTAFCGNCGSPVSAEFCGHCGVRSVLA